MPQPIEDFRIYLSQTDFRIYLSQTDRLFAVAVEGQAKGRKAIISLVHNTCN